MHFRKLEAMFYAASINQTQFPKATIQIESGLCEIVWKAEPGFFHALGALHGAISFKWLDDAAYFAAASTVEDYFLLTKSFQIQFIRPFSEGNLVAKGTLEKTDGLEWVAGAKLFNDQGKVVASGEGIFVRSRTLLSEIPGYQ